MCDYRLGRLIIGVPNDARGVEAIEALRRGLVPDCTHLASLIDRLYDLKIDIWSMKSSQFLYHLVEVPPGDEFYLANFLVHNFNGQAGSNGLIAFAQPDHLLSLTSTHSPSSKDFQVDSFVHDQVKNFLNIKAAQANNHLGKGVLIAVVDSGLAQSSPARNSNSLLLRGEESQ
jgi:subtilase family serine protease